jgi:hypothetical protein
MPQINGVVVTDNNTGAQWQTGNMATVRQMAAATIVYCNADNTHQPPVGFLNNPGHNFVITGSDVANGQAYNSGNTHPNGGESEPPNIYAFS